MHMIDKHPKLTVIVIAHKFGPYIVDALESIKNQTLEKQDFDVIVVRDTEDVRFEAIIRSYGFKDRITDRQSFHDKIQIGLEESDGEILTFLEDDDLYEPERLMHILSVFKDYDDLGYYHNAHIPIDTGGNVLPRSLYLNIDQSLLIRPGEGYSAKLRYISKFSPSFNTSSMAVRRSIILKRLDYFKRMSAAVDNFMFTAAVSQRVSIYMDNRKLTRYRIHSSQTLRVENFNHFMRNGDSKAMGLYESYKIIFEMTEGTPAEEIWREHFLIYKSQFAIFQAANGDKSYLPDFRDMVFLMKFGISKKMYYVILLSVWTMLFHVAPSLFSFPYYLYKTWELNRTGGTFE